MNTIGMMPFEIQVGDYVEDTGNHVLYRSTPKFVGEELVARGVQLEGWSVEDGGTGICFNVFIYNVQPGIEIDYLTGESQRETVELSVDPLTETEISGDYVNLNKELSRSGCLKSTVCSEGVAQGSYAFTNKLPSDLNSYSSNDIWGFLDSQETQGISPEMYNEFIFPYYKKIADTYGRLSYGCCEAVDPIWEKSVSKYPRLGKVSISPWCDEKYMGQQLCGKEITYMRKPSPNLLGVGSELDEDSVRKHISATVEAAKGCNIEIIQRDVYKINNTYKKVRRYVEIIRECCDKYE